MIALVVAAVYIAVALGIATMLLEERQTRVPPFRRSTAEVTIAAVVWLPLVIAALVALIYDAADARLRR